MNFQLTIARKIFGLSFLALAFMIGTGAAGLFARHYLTVGADGALAAQEVLRTQMEADQAHDALRGDVLAALLAAREIDPEEIAAIRKDLDSHSATILSSLDQLAQADFEPTTRDALEKVRPKVIAYTSEARSLVAMATSDRFAAQARLPEFLQQYQQLEADMSRLGDLVAQRASAIEAENREVSERMGRYVTVGVSIAGLLLLAIGWNLSRSIVQRLDRAVQVARTVATGDLSSRIEVQGRDEAAQLLGALASMNENLVRLVGTVRQSSDSIAAGSMQIAGGNQDLSQRTEEQASNLQQTAASMEQLSAAVRANADSTRAASSMAATASMSAGHSGEAVRKLVESMAGITQASRRMTDIIGVIDGIAFQTNILALNAAVEAARAGEQGRGFAVVASEVRALAQRSAGAAREIKGLIETSVAQVQAGQQQAHEAGGSMAQVVEQVQQVTRLLQEIDAATLEQNKGIAEVSQAVTHIDHVTQSNASLVEEAAAAAESLNRQAERLVQAVALFRVDTHSTALVPA